MKTITETINTTELNQASILQQAIIATKQTDHDYSRSLLKAFAQQALLGTLTWQRSFVTTINDAIQSIDQLISQQLKKILQNKPFQQLEGSWRGLNHLVSSTQTSPSLRIKLLNVNKQQLFSDLDKAVEFDQSQLFKKVYESEYGMAGGEPYSVLIGDYEFSNHPQDIDMLRKISNVAAAAFSPFLSAASPQLLGFDSWTELSKPRDLSRQFDSVEYAKWRSFRQTADARFIALTMPRVLARLPYGPLTHPIEAFAFDETNTNMPHHHFCWMNAAYTLASRITQSFSRYGWSTAIRGTENGGKVDSLPLYTFQSDDGDIDSQCPCEIGITDRREAELSHLGFLPLCHYKNTDYAVFFGSQTVQDAISYDTPHATANAQISTRLPYIMATSRFAHYLKVMARDKIGSFMEASDCQDWLNRWILRYVNANAQANPQLKAKYPLADANIQVKEIPGQPGHYHAIAWLKPWLQLEELTTSLRLVARIPKVK